MQEVAQEPCAQHKVLHPIVIWIAGFMRCSNPAKLDRFLLEFASDGDAPAEAA